MILRLDTMSPGQRFRVLRAARGLKLWELAFQAGLPQGRLSEIETGRRIPTDKDTERLNAALRPDDELHGG